MINCKLTGTPELCSSVLTGLTRPRLRKPEPRLTKLANLRLTKPLPRGGQFCEAKVGKAGFVMAGW